MAAKPTVNETNKPVSKGQKKNNSSNEKKTQSTKTTKRYMWKDEGVYIGLDKNKFIGVVAYNRIDLLIYSESEANLSNDIKRIARHVKYIIESAKVGNEDVIYGDVQTEHTPGKTHLFQSVFIPYSLKSAKITSSLNRLKKVENENIKNGTFTYKKKNVLRIIVDPNKSKNADVFFKGFIASARIPPIYVDNEMKTDEKFHLRTGTFISDEVGYSKQEIARINRKELTMNKVSLFGDSTNYENEFSYFMPFKRRISMIVYQSYDIVNDGVLKTTRSVFDLGLHYKTIKQDGKIIDDFKTGPIGVFVSVYPTEEVELSDLKMITYDKDGKTLLYGSDSKASFDVITFEDESEIINKYFISPLMKPEDEPEPIPEPAKEETEEKETVSEETEEAADEVVTEEISDEEDNSESDNNQPFNDVGSLSDIEDDEDFSDSDLEDDANEEVEQESETPSDDSEEKSS